MKPIGFFESKNGFQYPDTMEVSKEEYLNLQEKLNPPIPQIPVESQLEAIASRQDFLEECIAELAIASFS